MNRKKGLDKLLDPSEIEDAAKGLLNYVKQKRLLKEKNMKKNKIESKRNPS